MGRHKNVPRLRFQTVRLDDQEYQALSDMAAATGRNRGELMRAGLLLLLASPEQYPAGASRRDEPAGSQR